ncbi:uncharacterized protein LOC119301334 isoform X1 [Triticum dicoccoides]|uniref:uncharacterized protein LOC119301334 isoform X1 n=1 Tax=Triticum dicoccoides TaxID=85692 RepID=UPI00188FC678|nr:uncharacterized protein LOC119301334 isoform X1 [Triticum dicoccoides]
MFPSPEQGPSPEKLHLLYILPQVQRRLLAHREHLAEQFSWFLSNFSINYVPISSGTQNPPSRGEPLVFDVGIIVGRSSALSTRCFFYMIALHVYMMFLLHDST